ncbi:MAG: polyketide synthase, partial [bacterium]|nr:polyketide synthase [bacterium]
GYLNKENTGQSDAAGNKENTRKPDAAGGTEEEKNVRRQQTGNTDIAVIGMAGRFPGADSIDEFWDNLKNGIESIAFLSNDQLEKRGLDPGLVARHEHVPAKGILRFNDAFDAFFFNYTPVEAEIMDPQVRIFHECAWAALENAGYDPGTWGGDIGLFAGASPNPYWEILPLKAGSGDSFYSEQWDAIQFSDKDYLSTRIAYKLDLKGPCLTLQTACSTSLVAVDQACQSLLAGKCEIALAGGVSVTLQDEAGYPYRNRLPEIGIWAG